MQYSAVLRLFRGRKGRHTRYHSFAIDFQGRQHSICETSKKYRRIFVTNVILYQFRLFLRPVRLISRGPVFFSGCPVQVFKRSALANLRFLSHSLYSSANPHSSDRVRPKKKVFLALYSIYFFAKTVIFTEARERGKFKYAFLAGILFIR